MYAIILRKENIKDEHKFSFETNLMFYQTVTMQLQTEYYKPNNKLNN